MNLTKPNISFFVPAYNEEKNLATVINEADAVLREIANTYEILIVNDGSTDKTSKIADALGKSNPAIKTIHQTPNQGYGAALQTGFRTANKEYIFFTDADLQFNIQELKQFLPFIPEYKAVLGFRENRKDSTVRLLNAKAWNLLNRFLFGLKVRDIDCAFKLFHRSVFDNISISSRGAMVSAELLIKLQRKGISFKEIPVSHFRREYGSATGAKFSVIKKAFQEMIQLYRGDLGGVTHKQVLKFIIVGIINTSIDLMAYFFLTRGFSFFGNHKVTAKILSFSLGTISSFIMNRKWTFQIQQQITFKEFFGFYITVGAGLMLNALVMYVFVHVFVIHDIGAAIIATLVSFVWNFTLSKFWVFRSKSI